MKKNSTKITGYVLCLWLVLLHSCTFEHEVSIPFEQRTDNITPDLEEWMDALPTETMKLDKILLPNGQTVKEFMEKNDPSVLPKGGRMGTETDRARVLTDAGPQNRKNLLIGYMLAEGAIITNKQTKFTDVSIQRTNGVTREQLGIWYKMGGSDPTDTKKPLRQSKSSICHLESNFHGLDCSGLMIWVAKKAMLNLPRLTASGLANIKVWQAALKAAGDKYDKVDVKAYEYGKLSYDDLQTGDLVFFKNKASGQIHHAGIAYGNVGEKATAILNSFGRDDKHCERNESSQGGPVAMRMDCSKESKGTDVDCIKKQYPASNEGIVVLRFITKVADNWELSMACQGRTSEPARLTVKIDIPETADQNDQPFETSGDGMDYEGGGGPFTATLKGKYYSKDNRLAGEIVVLFTNSGTVRIDSFDAQQLQDDSGWLPTKKIQNNGGCSLLVSLKRQR
ncbi:C40 family peptidase [Spirosoma endophyticum]|uniref:NlpC/P60 family protein n=1 Tax=Spirosoma endophyticum TaxID=662367 RepID=A0A1I2GGQ2_9BACT|nr:NlpC/P60 family protein [Spirosoma endophyticum]SFF16160.1 NlpC/P60 family protein [Spirosoma endophyticum]